MGVFVRQYVIPAGISQIVGVPAQVQVDPSSDASQCVLVGNIYLFIRLLLSAYVGKHC